MPDSPNQPERQFTTALRRISRLWTEEWGLPTLNNFSRQIVSRCVRIARQQFGAYLCAASSTRVRPWAKTNTAALAPFGPCSLQREQTRESLLVC